MNRKLSVKWSIFLLSITVTFVSWLAVGQFILDQKEKKVPRSSSTLREQCAKEMGEILQKIPVIMRGIADVQSSLLPHIYAFLDGEPCFLVSAKKDQLFKLWQKLVVYNQQMIKTKQGLQEVVASIQSLDNQLPSTKKAKK